MNSATELKLNEEKSVGILTFYLVLWAIFWLTITAAAYSNEPVEGLIQACVISAAILLYIKGKAQAEALIDGVRVIRNLRAPTVLWRKWLIACVRGSLGLLAFLIACNTILLSLPRSPWSWITAPALLSAALCLGTLVTLARHRIIKMTWVAILAGLGSVYIFLFTLSQYVKSTFDIFDHPPLTLQIAVIVAWPALCVWMLRWSQPPEPIIEFKEQAEGFIKRIGSYLRRFSLLTRAMNQRNGKAISSAPPIRKAFAEFIFPIYLSCIQIGFVKLKWMEPISLKHYMFLILLCGVCVQSLTIKDLNWRRALSPNGKRNNIGWRILSATLMFQLSFFSIVGGIIAIIAMMFFGASLVDLLSVAWTYRVMFLNVIFADCVALTILGLALSSAYLAAFLVGILLVPAFAFGYYWFMNQELHWGRAEMTYVFLQSGLSLLFAIVGNHLWTNQKLAKYLPMSGKREIDD
jgi:hypothetical protein